MGEEEVSQETCRGNNNDIITTKGLKKGKVVAIFSYGGETPYLVVKSKIGAVKMKYPRGVIQNLYYRR